jgi:drug/metabolite transporter (DMT)-like permease
MTFVLTVLALVAFAANSVLCRLALGGEAIDPWSFTVVRLGTGALVLVALTVRRRRTLSTGSVSESGSVDRWSNWKRAAYLVLYALPFSLAYVSLDAGTGALLLFGAVQLTMIALGLRAGERPRLMEWLAFLGAAGGMVYFVLPGVTAPDPLGAALMVASGVGWGFYSIAGKGAGDPAVTTADAFWRAALVVVPAITLVFTLLSVTSYGLLLATVSGALTSGIGYVIWYAALRHISATRAALVQLSVPIIAAAGGVAFLAEAVTPRLVIASVVILGSIALGVAARRTPA